MTTRVPSSPILLKPRRFISSLTTSSRSITGTGDNLLERIDAEMAGNRCDGDLFNTAALQSFGQLAVNFDLNFDVAFSLVSQQGSRVCMSHRQVKIPTGSSQRRDQVSIVVVSSGWTDADDHSDMHV